MRPGNMNTSRSRWYCLKVVSYLANQIELVSEAVIRWSGSSPFGRGRIGGGWKERAFGYPLFLIGLKSKKRHPFQPPPNPLHNKERESTVKNLTYKNGTLSSCSLLILAALLMVFGCKQEPKSKDRSFHPAT